MGHTSDRNPARKLWVSLEARGSGDGADGIGRRASLGLASQTDSVGEP